MMKKLSVLAGTALAVGLALGAPAAATADPYAPTPGGGTASVAPGSPVTFTVAGFLPNESVVISAPDAVSLAASINKTASGTGTVTFTASSAAAGTYSITITGASSGAVTYQLVVDPALAYTGSFDATPYLWMAGGIVALGAGAVITAAAVRRQRVKA
ncbi:MAG: hypothetical protein J7480_06115 [Microbacteriaceae bacterium]|nr:hypothetical protein [Microbacteriaceae bacterium]